MLFQTDEIDGMLQSINKAQDARHENIMGTLLTLYSTANSVFPMRRKAGKESPGVIDQPCLVIFGTAIPNHYYEALSERMLTNGFFARMIILECGQRGTGQEPKIVEIPDRACWKRPAGGRTSARYRQSRELASRARHRTAHLRSTADSGRARREAESEYERAEQIATPSGRQSGGESASRSES